MMPKHSPWYPWLGIPPVEVDPWHVPGGPEDQTPRLRSYPMGPMPRLPGVWGARLPEYETYRPYAQFPNGIVGQTFEMTLADVWYAYESIEPRYASRYSYLRDVRDGGHDPRWWPKYRAGVDDGGVIVTEPGFLSRAFRGVHAWSTPDGDAPDPGFLPMAWPDFYDLLGVPTDDVRGGAEYSDSSEAHRWWLEQRILERFWLREIRGETPAQFLIFLHRHLAQQMPSLNPVFESLENVSRDDLMGNNDLTTDGTSSSNGASTRDTSQTSISSTNPLQSKVLHSESDYYDAGQKADATEGVKSTDDGRTQTHARGYSGRSLSQGVTEWALGVNSALTLLYSDLEDCFSQLYTDHSIDLY